jgi:simple sugar transport system permease protein
MDAIIILQAGVASGTVLLFATLGEILAERSGVLNLGVEGMMLIGAMSGYSTALSTGNPWLGVIVAMLAAGLLSQIHALITIRFQADQVVSGLALTFLGTGLSLVFGEGLSKAGAVSLLPSFSIPGLELIPFLGPILFVSGISSIAPGLGCTCGRLENFQLQLMRWGSTWLGYATSTFSWGVCLRDCLEQP